MNNEEEWQEMVKKIIDDFVALSENASYVKTEKDLRELLEQSKELGFIMCARLNEILGCLIVDWLKLSGI